MNLLYLVNAIVLGFLGVYLYLEKRSQLTRFFLLSNIGLAAWNLCIFLVVTDSLTAHVDLISRLQLVAAMCFVNGYYYLCISYPVAEKISRITTTINLTCFVGLIGVILFTKYITFAEVENGVVVYRDNQLGYGIYTFYLMFFCLASLAVLIRHARIYKQYKNQIKYLFLGISLYVLTAIVCNLILPVFGEYRFLTVGRLSAIFPSLFFSYVIVKHSFLDMEVIINSRLSWLVTVVLMGLSTTAIYSFALAYPDFQYVIFFLTIVAWGFIAAPLQGFLLTSAKRKFIRGWYSTEAVMSELASLITLDKSRESIFRTVEKIVDDVFELETSVVIVAARDENDTFSYYRVVGGFQRIDMRSALVRQMASATNTVRLHQISAELERELQEIGVPKSQINHGLMLPFHSPEMLEGILIIGERSNQNPYTATDLQFFDNLIAFISPVLYRLTPMEKLENLYFDNKQKLHEAEIQLIRAQKIESIVHATRQCHHEIRTPLNIIKLGIGRIKSLDELENFKRVAKEEIDHALEIVEETLSISDVHRGDSKRRTFVNMNDVIRRCLRLVDTMQYKVSMDLGDIPEIEASFSDLQVVLTNLIHNAMDAMPGGGSLSFSTRVHADTILIMVEDTGEGIPDDLKSRVWEPYFSGKISRVGNSTAGRGWGLTIVNRIVDEHGGTIRFTSEPGAGTRFTITLPAHSASGMVLSESDNVVPLPLKRR